MCMIECDEYATIWNEDTVKARKPHRCSCCRATINRGENYLRHASLFDGHWTNGILCQQCEADRDKFAAAHEGFIPGPREFPWILAGCISDGDDESERLWSPMLDRINASRRAAKVSA